MSSGRHERSGRGGDLLGPWRVLADAVRRVVAVDDDDAEHGRDGRAGVNVLGGNLLDAGRDTPQDRPGRGWCVRRPPPPGCPSGRGAPWVMPSKAPDAGEQVHDGQGSGCGRRAPSSGSTRWRTSCSAMPISRISSFGGSSSGMMVPSLPQMFMVPPATRPTPGVSSAIGEAVGGGDVALTPRRGPRPGRTASR